MRGPLTEETTAFILANSIGHAVRTELHFGGVLCYSDKKQPQENKCLTQKKVKKRPTQEKVVKQRKCNYG